MVAGVDPKPTALTVRKAIVELQHAHHTHGHSRVTVKVMGQEGRASVARLAPCLVSFEKNYLRFLILFHLYKVAVSFVPLMFVCKHLDHERGNDSPT